MPYEGESLADSEVDSESVNNKERVQDVLLWQCGRPDMKWKLKSAHIDLVSFTQTDVTHECHMMFWQRDSNAIFERKIAEICILVESAIFIAVLSSFGIVHFKYCTFKLCGHKFCFIGTLRSLGNIQNQ